MVKNPPATAGNIRDTGLIPRLGRSPAGRKWQLIPVFLPEESHGQRSLEGYGPSGHKESDTTVVNEHAEVGSSSRLLGARHNERTSWL